MEETLEGLERKREALCKQLGEIGDFRRGTISVNYRKCGKNNCACAREGHPGHGPQYLWSATIKGKTFARNVTLGTQMQKYMKEITHHKSFRGICRELVEINEKICDLRPVPEAKDEAELQELKKKLQKHFIKKYKEKSA